MKLSERIRRETGNIIWRNNLANHVAKLEERAEAAESNFAVEVDARREVEVKLKHLRVAYKNICALFDKRSE